MVKFFKVKHVLKVVYLLKAKEEDKKANLYLQEDSLGPNPSAIPTAFLIILQIIGVMVGY